MPAAAVSLLVLTFGMCRQWSLSRCQIWQFLYMLVKIVGLAPTSPKASPLSYPKFAHFGAAGHRWTHI